MITINWSAKIIYVPQTFLDWTGPGEVYSFDLNAFRLALKDLEDDEIGIVFDDTHIHYPPVAVGSVSLARVIEIINGYTVTFENGQYAVNFVGANTNVADVANVNQVSIRPNNSAGLIETNIIETITTLMAQQKTYTEAVPLQTYNTLLFYDYDSDIATAVLDKPVNNHLAEGSVGEALALLRGYRYAYALDGGPGMANIDLDSQGLMLAGRIRIFSTAVAAAAATPGAATGVDNELVAIELSANSIAPGRLGNMVMATGWTGW